MLFKELIKDKYVIMDIDGTISNNPNPYLTIAKSLSVKKETINLVNKYLDSKITYKDLTNQETELFNNAYNKKYPTENGINISYIKNVLKKITIRKGAKETYEYIKKNSKDYIFLSSGIKYYCEDIISKIEPNKEKSVGRIYANTLTFDKNGILKNRKIDVEAKKISALKRIIKERNWDIKNILYIGDNEFDNKVIKYIVDKGGDVLFLNDEKTLAKTLSYNTKGNIIASRTVSELLIK